MRARWEALRAAFIHSMNTFESKERFQQAHGSEAILAGFESPARLVQHLADPSWDRDRKDAIYAALVRASQAHAPWTEVADAILWCGLWPGLDGIYRRQLRHFRNEPEELVSALSTAFTGLVARLDLRLVHRVAATLVRSTERDLTDDLRRGWAERASRKKLLEESGEAPHKRDSELGIPSCLPFDGELEVLRDRLRPVVGRDTDLVLAAVVGGESQREIAERLGRGHEATRKRCARALRRLREKSTWACPRSRPRTAFRGVKGPRCPQPEAGQQ
jgi:hypothetical protein